MVALTRQVRMQAPNNGSRGFDQNLTWRRMGDRYLDSLRPEEINRIVDSLPPARAAANALHAQRSLLVSWCRKLGSLPTRGSVAAMADHLLSHFDQVHVHSEAGQLVTGLRKLDAQVLRVIDSPVNRMRVQVPGRCPEKECGGSIEAVVPHEKPPVVRCLSCGKTWDSTQWTRLGARILHAA